MTFPKTLLSSAHFHILRNEDEVKRSQLCGCYHCQSVFPAQAVTAWGSESCERYDYEPEGWERRGAASAVCPKCGFDNVIGDASGFPVGDADFIRAMHDHHW